MVDASSPASPHLAGLKDFQRRTVDYVFGRLYGPGGSRRFLVADEVGLGKTLVARGVIARSLAYLRASVPRIDVIYICSNAAIARQNVDRLRVGDQQSFAIATRLTLLPTQVHALQQNPVNFVSFTPGTTFDLKNRGGRAEERVLIYRLLWSAPWSDRDALRDLLQATVQDRDRWQQMVNDEGIRYDETLAARFRDAVARDTQLVEGLQHWFQAWRNGGNLRHPMLHEERYALIGNLRRALAHVCIGALDPDLVIIDEFQRFRELLDGEHEAALLARALFDYPNVRVLLLSATPYRMLSLNHEQDEDHYSDFVRTLRFLIGEDDAEVEAIRTAITDYRRSLLALPLDLNGLHAARGRLQSQLLKVMCRTERVGMTQQLDAMLFEARTPLTLAADDLAQARVCDGTSQALGGPDVVEYWKSAPYLLNFQRDYELGRKLKDVLLSPPAALLDLLQEAKGTMLRKDAFENYQDVPAANARLRALFAETLDIGLWRLLWLPPCMPYAEPRGPFQGIGSVTKALVFSSWHMVPDVIAALCSYEAERRMLGDVPASRFEHSQLYDRVKPLLRFARSSDGRLTGMPVLAWLLPSPSLAFAWDPLEAALRIGQGKPVDAEVLLADASSKIAALLQGLPQGAPSGRPDERWYWAALALLDADTQLPSWCRHRDAWPSAAGEHEHGKSFYDHVSHFAGVAPGQDLGPQPQDLIRILAEMMLAAPGICALRALKRQAPTLTDDDPCLLSAAARIAEGFRTLFNLPETIALLRGDGDDTYWRLVLKYAIDGNLQSLLDEQVHILVEWLGLADHRPEQIVEGVSTALAQAVSLRTARVSIDEVRVTQDTIEIEPFNTRCRFALRFGDVRDDAGSALARAEVVRDAFNSPFRPFILASTSIGQEGLDFHLWCHAVVHWNLPSNPVDLEQREGRVHRHKGHAIRKNIVECYGLESLVGWDGHGDPWEALFAHAAADRRPEESDLTPYWVFERGSARIERRVPVLPYTREVMRLRSLKRGLALYRLVFGQPRQEDLLAYLAGQLDDDAARQLGVHCRISLEPPAPLVPGPLPLPAQAIDNCYPPQNPVCTKR